MKKYISPTVILTLSVTFVFVFSACRKEYPEPAYKTSSKSPEIAAKCWDYCCSLSSDENGEYSCPTPYSDCARLSDCPTGVISLDDAIARSAVGEFFSNKNRRNWEQCFNAIGRQPQVLKSLQDGSATMIKKTKPSGKCIFIVVPAGTTPAQFDGSQTLYAIDVADND